MPHRHLDEEQRRCVLERGSVVELELMDWETDGLSASSLMSLRKQVLFLRAFAVRGIVLQGCQAAGVSRGAVANWKENSEWFRIMYNQAIDEAADRIELEAHRRAVEGYEEPVFYQGMPTTCVDPNTGELKQVTIRKFSDQLMLAILKGARPDKYRDNHKVEIEGQVSGVLVVPGAIDAASWAAQAAQQQAKYTQNEGTPGDDSGSQ